MKRVLLVRDLGMEIPVPDITWDKPEVVVPALYGSSNVSIGSGTVNSVDFRQFNIRILPDGNYELDNMEFLREALEFMYKHKPAVRTPIISRMIDASAIDISNARIKSYTVSANHDDIRTIDLELII